MQRAIEAQEAGIGGIGIGEGGQMAGDEIVKRP
jgi:hypothetical protein